MCSRGNKPGGFSGRFSLDMSAGTGDNRLVAFGVTTVREAGAAEFRQQVRPFAAKEFRT
jgi:hypothetical protein